MRRMILFAAMLSLTACAMPTIGGVAGPVVDAAVPTKPADIADRTTLDERLATGVTISYTAASRLGTALARAGLIDKAQFKKLDQQGYDAVLAVKAAYDASNASSYAAAINRVNDAVAGINRLVR